jgi:predicted esterase
MILEKILEAKVFIMLWLNKIIDSALIIILPCNNFKKLHFSVPPLLQIHGDSDDLVDFGWGESTFKKIKNLGVDGQFHVMERLGHSINKRGMHIIKEWIQKHLPEIW